MNKKDFITEDLLSKIYQEKYKVGEKLPTERILATQYSVSRHTIREALKKLLSIGSIRIVQGSGIFISEVNYKSPLIYNSLTEKKFKDIQSELIYLKKIMSDITLKQIFDLHEAEPIWEFKRIRMIDSRKVQIEVSWLPCRYFNTLTEEDITHSIHSYVQKQGYQISHFITSYSAVSISKDEAEILKCKKGLPAMKIINRGILQTSQVFEYSELISLDYSCSYISPFNALSHQYRQGK